MTPLHRRAGVLALALCGLCAQAPAFSAIGAEVPKVTSITDLPPPPPHEWADTQVSLNEHRIAGNGLVSMPALQQYLNGLYAKLKVSAGVPDWPGSVYISSDQTLNAHSSASGNIYLHIAMIQSAETEDEIYAVLAHEFSHIYLNHQAVYERHETTENLRFAATVLGTLTKKIGDVAGTGWGMKDTVGLADDVAHNALIPSWQREAETQADMAGANLSLRANYSYPVGFKAFLERLATIEDREAAEAATDPVKAQIAASARKTHATAHEREATLTELVAPVLPRPRPAARKAPWQAALRERGTAEVLAHYALLPRIAELQTAHRSADALKLAQVAASGATAGDATMLLALQDAMQKTGATPAAQAAVLMRNNDWPERSWTVLRQSVYLGTLTTRPDVAKTMMETTFTGFGEPPAAMPDMVAFYLATKDGLAQTVMLTRCLQYASYRQACGVSGQTEQQRAQQEAKDKAHQDQLGNNLADKVKKAFKWN